MEKNYVFKCLKNYRTEQLKNLYKTNIIVDIYDTDMIYDENDEQYQKFHFMKENLDNILNETLTPIELDLISKYYFQMTKMHTLAKELNISQQAVSVRLSKIVLKLRKYLDNIF